MPEPACASRATVDPSWTRAIAAGGCCAALLLQGCAGGPAIDTRYHARSHDSRVQFLVIHYTHGDLPRAIDVLTAGAVSSHYLVADDPPVIYRLVDENRRAFHAGLSSWRGYTNLNAASIGIEIVNRGCTLEAERWSCAVFPQPQIGQVIALARDIVRRHAIRPEHVVGHADIAPQRKIDPGPAFPWKLLAEAGIGRWPDEAIARQRLPLHQAALPDVGWFQQKLAAYGYQVATDGILDTRTRNVIAAFQMHFRPRDASGNPDAETAALLDALTGY
jgi:N-acetylmuramoyl-L-alanine amidase